ncbi:hypothetical protein O181_034092 [Austropuccinia psidii MF-1]|uniref:Uncharacterized protein n=1 Tax=Austropuccinia psidii MF-1 TaxID=1389203 RepID=A0A9Q3D2K9_9BASI|nr:hypothetical protein [Austropuccinia psidii MF-1]
MPVQHSPPERQAKSQARAQAVHTATLRAPLDRTTAAPQLRAQLDRGSNFKGAAPFRKEGREEEKYVEEEESYDTEGVPAAVGESRGNGGPTIAQSNQPFPHQSEPSLLAIMQKMTQIMANLQPASSSEEAGTHPSRLHA